MPLKKSARSAARPMPSGKPLDPNLPGSVLAIAAHPDDIEFQMAGTLLLLKQASWAAHYFNLSNGDCGSMEEDASTTARRRAEEARHAAKVLGCTWHPPVTRDMGILYSSPLLKKVAAVIRKVQPSVILTHPPVDYMEDHTNTCRLAVSAAFIRGAPNFTTTPSRPAWDGECVVYHSMPHGLMDHLRRKVEPALWVNTASVIETKREALRCHQSQLAWLAATQGPDSYVEGLDRMSAAIARQSGRFSHAEGWCRHSPMGFSHHDRDPLREALGSLCLVNQRFEKQCQ